MQNMSLFKEMSNVWWWIGAKTTCCFTPVCILGRCGHVTFGSNNSICRSDILSHNIFLETNLFKHLSWSHIWNFQYPFFSSVSLSHCALIMSLINQDVVMLKFRKNTHFIFMKKYRIYNIFKTNLTYP